MIGEQKNFLYNFEFFSVINIDNVTKGKNIDGVGDVELGLKGSSQNLGGINISVNEEEKKLINEQIKPSSAELKEKPLNNEKGKVYRFAFNFFIYFF